MAVALAGVRGLGPTGRWLGGGPWLVYVFNPREVKRVGTEGAVAGCGGPAGRLAGVKEGCRDDFTVLHCTH